MLDRPPVTPGQMRSRVALQARTETPDGSDDYTQAHSTVASVWAAVEGIGGGKYIAGQQVEQRTTHRVTIRFRSDFQTWNYVLLPDGRRLIVRDKSDPDDTKRFLEMSCEEETPA